MNYQHAFHAGNFADVIKHVILTALFGSLSKKDAPLCYIDTHAGAGFYDLNASSTKKTKEYLDGIEKVIKQDNPPALIKHYLDTVHQINNELTHSKFSSLRFYPGSPLIARHLMRPHDRIVACELQQSAYQALKETFAGDKQIAVHHSDGYLGLKAFLPPKERRGIILIDPPYEDPDEFRHLAHTLPSALKRFETGVYAIWYPIKDTKQIDRFYRALTDSVTNPILSVELTIYPDLPTHLNGSGMAIINPPWQLQETLQEVLPWLWKTLSINGQGGYSVKLVK